MRPPLPARGSHHKAQYRSDSAKDPDGLLGGTSRLRPATVSSALDVELGHLAFDDARVGT
jgi:hypothetical protein